MHVEGPATEIPLVDRPRRTRRQRVLCLAFAPLLAVPLLLVSGPFAPVDRAAPVALQSVTGSPSHTSTTTAASAPSAAAPAALRRATTTVPAPTTTSTTTTTEAVVPEQKSAPPSTTAPPTTAPATTTPPTTTPPTTAAPRPAPTTTTTTTTTPPTTTTTSPHPVSPSRQSGQATWYRWKKGNCAHNTLPKGTRVTVTAVASGRTATCVVGDRGAFRNPTIIDLDASVFEQIAPLGAGRIGVVISW